jgi:hypothetical protein
LSSQVRNLKHAMRVTTVDRIYKIGG